jgi:uncharacterized protein YjbJ (UPF0337 family)
MRVSVQPPVALGHHHRRELSWQTTRADRQKAKEAVGAVTGRDDLQREGESQQDKADAQRDAAKKEAEGARGAADASEAREEAEQ